MWGSIVSKISPGLDLMHKMPFDPDAGVFKPEDLPAIDYPYGTILKIKTCPADLTLRKRGRVEMSLSMLTCEHWRRVRKFNELTINRMAIRNARTET
jgi:hypothetical protein